MILILILNHLCLGNLILILIIKSSTYDDFAHLCMYPAKWLDIFVEVWFRVIESISQRRLTASNSTLFLTSPLYVWSFDGLIDAKSFFHYI